MENNYDGHSDNSSVRLRPHNRTLFAVKSEAEKQRAK